jgi:hypothetical protein
MKRKYTKPRIYFFIGLLLFFFLWQSAFNDITGISQKNICSDTVMDYCDLVKNPEKYDGKEVTVRATYRYGFEWQEMFCLECRKVGKTWLEFDSDNTKPLEAALKKTPKDMGTINAVFSGIFQSSKGPFGDGGYRFKFTVKVISNVEVVYKDGRDPEQLPSEVRQKVCGSITSPQ